MVEAVVEKQEVAVHVFVPLDDPRAEDGVGSLRAMWERFRVSQEAGTPLPGAIPVQVPRVLPVAAAHGSVPVTAVQSQDRVDQAILRRHYEILNLSILLGAGPDRGWAVLRRRMEGIVGELGPVHLGAVTLELGELPADTPGALDLLEPEGGDETRAERLLRMLGRSGDPRLGAWAWSDGGTPAMPPFVRYLLHTTAVRHQWSVHRRVIEGRAAGGAGPRVVVRPPYSGASHRVLTDPTTELRLLRHSVSGSWDNARQALGASGRATGIRLDDAAPLAADRQFVSWFLGNLDDALTIHQLAGGPVGEAPLVEAVPVEAPQARAPRASGRRPVRVLAVADEWFPAHGGVTTFNRALCVALAAAGADVRVKVVAATAEERDDALANGVRLIDAARPGLGGHAALLRRPVFADGFEPDLVLGHGRVTGPAARQQAEDHFPGAARLHFLHVEPDRAEASKPHAEGSPGVRAQDRTELELELCRGALRPMPVGPRLASSLRRHRRGTRYRDIAPPLRIDPGFDGREAVLPPDPDDIPQILLMGRLQDDLLKGLDIACRALGQAVPDRAAPGTWELLLRGVPGLDYEKSVDRVTEWIANSAVDVTLYPYSADPWRIENDVARAGLVLMPSRAEAFGLAGLEAIAAGVPVLVSGRSGLGMLLREQGLQVADRAVVDVDGRGEEADVRRWQTAISAVMWDLKAAFGRAAELRSEMATRVTWAKAAATVLDCAGEQA
ncbi:CATRA conflict system CASPASE/TPR repeat-associated protein [Streptomyces sp. NPDC086077]|uniref:CATRA conflict system CASPASE/TPR repeat-associated protein n=1 Tax=Streptomyces sp. NPDC086077 TaxID=3154862 RepID=UPI0034172D4D